MWPVDPYSARTGSGTGRSRPRRRHVVELAVAGLLSVLAAVALTWPTLRDPARMVPTESIDPLIEVWSIAAAGHGLLHDPLHVFDANAFFPSTLSLAYTDSMLGYGPAAWLSDQPLLVYNALFVFCAALVAWATYALARQLGANPVGAALAAAAFGFAPWRIGQAAHLHVLSTGPMVLSLAMLARGHGLTLVRGRVRGPWRPGWVVLGWLAACWQVSIGFAIGLPFGYLLGLLGIVAAVRWLVRPASRPPRRVLVADAVGGALFAATALAMALPYLQVQRREAVAVSAARGLSEVERYSPQWRGWLAPPGTAHGLWSWLDDTALLRGYPVSGEVRLYPGLVLLACAVVGLGVSVWAARWRATLAAAVVVSGALAMGATLPGSGTVGFLALWRHAPGWAADRTPGRLVTFTLLALALLAAGAVTAATEAARRRLSTRRGRALALTGVAVLPLLALAEGVGPLPQGVVTRPPAAFADAQQPLMVLPSLWDFDSTVMYWSTLRGFPSIVNGASGITPTTLRDARAAVARFPDARSVAWLRGHGVRSVVLLRLAPYDLAPANPHWATAPDIVPPPSLGLTRTDLGDAVLYQVRSGP